VEQVLTLGSWTPVEKFGVSSGWAMGAADADGAFEVSWRDTSLGRVRWTQLGEHNRLNALAAIAAARHAGVEPGAAISALGSFAGVRRRMELRGQARGVSVYDDFAHHPTAIRATVEGLRRQGVGRILAVLEPRSNTMKRGVMKDALPASLEGADLAYVYTAGLGWDAEAVFAPMARAYCSPDLAALVRTVAREARAGDRVLVMSNGGFGGIHAKLLAALASERGA
jgi:UDP-N-acetylmuramate: L-alanyl-gamma-D-glutamyl-meso-diaminopimelate ligase